jgi:hypothetical protein
MLVLAAHFEGGGALHVLNQVNPSAAIVADLRRRDEIPSE